MKSAIVRPFQFLVFLAYWATERFVGILSLKACARLGEMLGLLALYILPPYRRLVRENLRLALDSDYSRSQLDCLVQMHFEALGRNIVSSMRTARMSPTEVASIVTYEGVEHLKSAHERGKGVVAALSHLANWELYSRIQPFQENIPLGHVYQAIRNPFLNRHIEKTRSRFGTKSFERKGGFFEPAKFLREGGVLGVLFDQSAGSNGVLCPYFDRLLPTTILPAVLSKRTGAAVVFVSMLPDGVGKWKITFHPPIFEKDKSEDYVSKVTSGLNQNLEQVVRDNPAEWFWVHNRWKQRGRNLFASGSRIKVMMPDGMSKDKLKPLRIVVWSPNPLGDACMALPALRAIKNGRPDIWLSVACRSNLEPMWTSQADVDEVIPFTKGDHPWAVGKTISEGREPFRVAILLPNSIRSVFEAKAADIPLIAGYSGEHRERFLGHYVEPIIKTEKMQHHVHHYLHLAKSMGADVSQLDDLLQIPQAPTPIVAGEKKIHIGICPGAEYGNAKRYPTERYAEAVRRLRAERSDLEISVSIYGSPAERWIGEELAEMLDEPKANRVGETSISGLVDELKTCHFLASNDTGTMHLAAALGVPTVAIFGSTEPDFTSPIGNVHRVIRHKVDCSPCFKRECPIDYRCMLRIEPDEVMWEMKVLLGEA